MLHAMVRLVRRGLAVLGLAGDLHFLWFTLGVGGLATVGVTAVVQTVVAIPPWLYILFIPSVLLLAAGITGILVRQVLAWQASRHPEIVGQRIGARVKELETQNRSLQAALDLERSKPPAMPVSGPTAPKLTVAETKIDATGKAGVVPPSPYAGDLAQATEPPDDWQGSYWRGERLRKCDYCPFRSISTEKRAEHLWTAHTKPPNESLARQLFTARQPWATVVIRYIGPKEQERRYVGGLPSPGSGYFATPSRADAAVKSGLFDYQLPEQMTT
jgi:hypothetical protein